MLTITEKDNGNLLLQASNETRAFIKDKINEGANRWYILSELFEDYSCNGSYEIFDAGDANPFVGLTSAPCIAETMDNGDNGERVVIGKLWYFNEYMIIDELLELKNKGRVTFILAD